MKIITFCNLLLTYICFSIIVLKENYLTVQAYNLWTINYFIPKYSRLRLPAWYGLEPHTLSDTCWLHRSFVRSGWRETGRQSWRLPDIWEWRRHLMLYYFTINALQKLGRSKDADTILLPILKSMSEGNFQGRCSNGRSNDRKTWSGECWGYEGFLVDNYMFLLAVNNQLQK